KGDFYSLRAKGESMVDAGIDEDDLLVIERNCPALEGNIVVALDEDNQNKCQAHCLALILLVTFVIQLLNSSIFVNLMN
ncbi:MAG: S24 family peptidase, partial [Firmicutes bacterium]|nr:S24 family peptidase [Bacillota bacterium]